MSAQVAADAQTHPVVVGAVLGETSGRMSALGMVLVADALPGLQAGSLWGTPGTFSALGTVAAFPSRVAQTFSGFSTEATVQVAALTHFVGIVDILSLLCYCMTTTLLTFLAYWTIA